MTPEEIADEAAAGFVHIDFGDRREIILGVPIRQEVGGPVFAAVSSQLLPRFHSTDFTENVAVKLRALIGALVLAAVERALRETPVPGAMSEERLAQIRQHDADFGAREVLVRDDLREVLSHVDHLTRALHDCGQDGSAAIWGAGYEAGKAAAEASLQQAWNAGFGVGATIQRGNDVAAAQAEVAHWLDAPSAWHVQQAVRAAKQADPSQQQG